MALSLGVRRRNTQGSAFDKESPAARVFESINAAKFVAVLGSGKIVLTASRLQTPNDYFASYG